MSNSVTSVALVGFLVSLADLHNRAPGILDKVFGPDGDFPLPPPFTGPVLLHFGRGSEAWVHVVTGIAAPGALYVVGGGSEFISEMALDFRIPTVAVRVLLLCAKVTSTTAECGAIEIFFSILRAGLWDAEYAAELVTYLLAIAPRIVAHGTIL